MKKLALSIAPACIAVGAHANDGSTIRFGTSHSTSTAVDRPARRALRPG
ncbi:MULTISPECIES: hypothetical protein [Burkholderia]|uniref:Porin n=2 Tax=Burkholderia TaxID=32008 RepID=A0ABW7LAI2_9BURK|nr:MULTISPECIES: hypothetical protein [Burkholderia]MEB2505330.1 hypothetical protein [Burkholderia anthinoferrum]MEB2530001.1 hypothetical protein [Burkholderia anthinoferrum]MEB2563565.1 hypothetical protein [Burkholderia anthinoferrum]MEB2582239.1 hypothetical protein [Burkholderia anthinoferrum]MCA7971849.1 hypothetical protein [Burkholderia sp. AU39826]